MATGTEVLRPVPGRCGEGTKALRARAGQGQIFWAGVCPGSPALPSERASRAGCRGREAHVRGAVRPLPPTLHLHQGQVSSGPSWTAISLHVHPSPCLSPEVMSPIPEGVAGVLFLEASGRHRSRKAMCSLWLSCVSTAFLLPWTESCHVVVDWTLLSPRLSAIPPLAFQQMMTMTWK